MNSTQPTIVIQSLSVSDYEIVDNYMKERKAYLLKKCHENGLDVVGNDSLHKPNAWEYLVNRKHHIIWCNIFKAASSSWMYNFNILSGYTPEFLRKTKAVPLMLARKKYPRYSVEKV